MTTASPDARPYQYYDLMRQSKDPKHLRLKMVAHAKAHGIKAAARAYGAAPNTVRKWFRRYKGKLSDLAEQPRAPARRPQKIDKAMEDEILRCKKLAPHLGAKRLKLEFDIKCNHKAIERICREHNLNHKYRRKKHQTKRYLREIKKQWNLFQQIDIDCGGEAYRTKNLCDIPEYWLEFKHLGLPQYQSTARDVTTGLLFLGYADELSIAYATLFADRIIRHMKTCGVDLSHATWQSDNGSEFIGSWQAKNDSAFTQMIQSVPGQLHKTIPPGQHRFQADVETVHSLMESEFYEIESFTGRPDFLAAANRYQNYFNLARKNSGKENKTPWQLVQEK